jgi:23S rRNA pseudouridine1911/1915/1917 synthase
MKVLLEAMRHEDPRDEDEEDFELSMEPYLADEDYEDEDEVDDEFDFEDDDDLMSDE